MTHLTESQRAHLIRAKHAKLARLDAERRQLVAELAVHEREHAIGLGVCALRGKMLLAEMDRRDAVQRAARGRVA